MLRKCLGQMGEGLSVVLSLLWIDRVFWHDNVKAAWVTIKLKKEELELLVGEVLELYRSFSVVHHPLQWKRNDFPPDFFPRRGVVSIEKLLKYAPTCKAYYSFNQTVRVPYFFGPARGPTFLSGPGRAAGLIYSTRMRFYKGRATTGILGLYDKLSRVGKNTSIAGPWTTGLFTDPVLRVLVS